MSRFRVTLEFDLDIHDEDQAQALASGMLRDMAAMEELLGGRPPVMPAGESPEVTAHRFAQDPSTTASLVAAQALARGTATMPWITASRTSVSSQSK